MLEFTVANLLHVGIIHNSVADFEFFNCFSSYINLAYVIAQDLVFLIWGQAWVLLTCIQQMQWGNYHLSGKEVMQVFRVTLTISHWCGSFELPE